MRGEAASFVVVFSACQKANSWIIISSQSHRVTSGQLASGRNYKNQSNHSQHFIPVLSLNSSNRKEIWVMSDQGTINNAESKRTDFSLLQIPQGISLHQNCQLEDWTERQCCHGQYAQTPLEHSCNTQIKTIFFIFLCMDLDSLHLHCVVLKGNHLLKTGFVQQLDKKKIFF